ncbi:SSI family serine proteinase inhibitor [Streptomyces sp. NPDC090052]|uniref:SSI family serine proteinase inhibitor n=1 Tax=unclassified Streptomyces TaxID=2593676 RepID=UPI00224DA6B1|nr:MULTISPECIES: SSI family serine proteinase inhibitor [unclassified Streptomyces]MCX4728037.1 subtilase-type protease inhibitor [Streptomyces sp. NBC_01306]WSV02736.1 subtilase-type protease inhibitor [Streptomyces sp. NBC_01020]WSX40807.1 subtilase-type protease inhibitor [Streptomyces sp. NBC_00963]WSX71226.1 subtilase-type protease inhibitor [Streptomyces sp. NBC_00932]
MRPRTMSAAAALLAFAAAVPAQAAGTPPIRPAGLVLSVASQTHPDRDRSVLLRCAPEQSDGSHPEAAAACRALDLAGGSFDRLAGEPRACTRQSDPVTVTVGGTWGGRPTHWDRTFANACSLDAATGPVFRF